MAVRTPAFAGQHSFRAQLVPELRDQGRQGYGPGFDSPYGKPGAPAPGTGTDAGAELAALTPALSHFLGAGQDGGGVNRGIILTDGNATQVAWPNPLRVALGVSIPSGSLVWHGFTQRVSANPGDPNAGTPVPSGSTWLYGTEWTGSVWIVAAAPFDIDVRILEISAPQ